MSSLSSNLNVAQYPLTPSVWQDSSVISNSSSSFSDHTNQSNTDSFVACIPEQSCRQSSGIPGHTEDIMNNEHSNLIKQNGCASRKYVETLYDEKENEIVVQNLLSAQNGLLEDLEEFLDEMKIENRKQEYLVSSTNFSFLVSALEISSLLN